MSLADYHERFAACYDTFYADRDVLADVQYAAGLLKLDASSNSSAHVLDLGCGSGSHVLAFARLGIDATGIDKSPAMIARALAKPVPKGTAGVRFVSGTFRDFCAETNGQTFDGVVSIFQVFNCMESAGEMLAHLKLVRSKLAVGSRFLIDLWNGAAVFADDPRPCERRFRDTEDPETPACHRCHNEDPSKEIVRVTTPQLDRINQRCTLHYRVRTLNAATRETLNEFESVHILLFLTPVQYRHLFELADLTIIDEFRRGQPGTPITDRDWYISYLLQSDT